MFRGGQVIGSREGLLFFLKCLEEGGISFSISSPFREGFNISSDEIFEYIKDPAGYLARVYEVPRDQYTAWLKVLADSRCRSVNKKGERCSNEVMSGPRHPDDINSASVYYCIHHLQSYPESDEYRSKIVK